MYKFENYDVMKGLAMVQIIYCINNIANTIMLELNTTYQA
jgi:hypothetical protein